MIDYKKALAETDTPSKLCRVAVRDMQALKAAMKDGEKVRFNSEKFHMHPAREPKVCLMCVAGAVARGAGLPDSEVWYPHGDAEREAYLFNKRMEFLSDLRLGGLNIGYMPGAENLSATEKAVLCRKIDTLFDENDPDDSGDIEGFIELYTKYAELFEKEGL